MMEFVGGALIGASVGLGAWAGQEVQAGAFLSKRWWQTWATPIYAIALASAGFGIIVLKSVWVA